MESQKIKENRRAKFLAKMENQNSAKKKLANNSNKPKENEKSTLIKKTQISQPNNDQTKEKNKTSLDPIYKKQTNNNKTNNNINLEHIFDNIKIINNLLNEYNDGNQMKKLSDDKKENRNIIEKSNKDINSNINNNEFNKNNKDIINNIKNDINKETPKDQKINYSEIMEKVKQFDSMINFQSIIKKILIIILSIIHCLNYFPLDNNIVKYTLIIIEISSLFFNKYYNDQKKKLTNININPKNQNNINVKHPDKSEKISQLLITNFEIFNQLFFIFNVIKDIISDISILFFINITFLIIKSILIMKLNKK